ncbi:hypothetical protein BKA60DRAFT_536185 [Fusarium oxysporum]|nr:hypothetical protein BKA60DRAFT_536185 [Fusarium oxysporum]
MYRCRKKKQKRKEGTREGGGGCETREKYEKGKGRKEKWKHLLCILINQRGETGILHGHGITTRKEQEQGQEKGQGVKEHPDLMLGDGVNQVDTSKLLIKDKIELMIVMVYPNTITRHMLPSQPHRILRQPLQYLKFNSISQANMIAYHPQRIPPRYTFSKPNTQQKQKQPFHNEAEDREKILLSLYRTQQLGNIEVQAATSQH